MSVGGPLIPGIEEFDRPKRGVPRLVIALIVVVLLGVGGVVAAGFVGGVGPLGSLGIISESLQPVGYRPTTDASSIQVAVAMPPEGMCAGDDIAVTAVETASSVEVSAELTRKRTTTCEKTSVGSTQAWFDIQLDAPFADRAVVRASDSQELPHISEGAIGN